MLDGEVSVVFRKLLELRQGLMTAHFSCPQGCRRGLEGGLGVSGLSLCFSFVQKTV